VAVTTRAKEIFYFLNSDFFHQMLHASFLDLKSHAGFKISKLISVTSSTLTFRSVEKSSLTPGIFNEVIA